jgi:hypothetical protein
MNYHPLVVLEPFDLYCDNKSMNKPAEPFVSSAIDAEQWVPPEVGPITDHQTDLPRLARDPGIVAVIEERISQIPTMHDLYRHDSRSFDRLPPNSIHLVVTSPPYWTLKDYREHPDQMGTFELRFELEPPRLEGCFRRSSWQAARAENR